ILTPLSLPMPLQVTPISQKFEHAMATLNILLRQEDGKYSPLIGFYSYTSTAEALNFERKFLLEKFLPLLKDLKTPLYVDHHYLGEMFGNLQHGIYFDPAPKMLFHDVPNIIQEWYKPDLRSITVKFGLPSEKNDCLYRCMEYIIGLATNQIAFEPDLENPALRLNRYLANESRKMQLRDDLRGKFLTKYMII
ncbi:hypothetical protein Bhyg_16320, partial [Pseudolycoriella hygida]